MTDNVAVVLQAVTKCLGDEVQTVQSANSEYYVTRPAAMTVEMDVKKHRNVHRWMC